MVTRNVPWFGVKSRMPCAALMLLLMGATDPALARGRHVFQHRLSHRSARMTHPRPGRIAQSGANFAAMVVDANTGRTLYSVNEDEPRHPASITKVMTLFLLFEQLESGRMRLDSPLTVSAHAAAQAPTKLGLRPGATIAVENAIKAIVTKSANDMAVAVAENIAGDEDSFAQAMTRKAHELGMTHTFYHNASGLPDMRQITTARDLTILGRAIRDRFPLYYHYFSTPSFTYAGSFMPNHNHLLDRVEGMDGIKTGYTAASGFNLLSSVNRDGRHIVSVVLGGRTAASRDRVMQSLIETHIEEASATPRTEVARGSPVEEPSAPPRREETNPDARTDWQPPRLAEAQDDYGQGDGGPIEREPPRGPNLIAPDLALPPVVTRPAEHVRLVPARPPAPPPRPAEDKPRPAFIAGAPRAIDLARLPGPLASTDRRRPASDGSTNHRMVAYAETTASIPTATPSSLHWVTGAQPMRLGSPAGEMKALAKSQGDGAVPLPPPARASVGPGTEVRASRGDAGRADDIREGSPTRGGWVIQVGATDDAEKARDLLSRAKSEGRSALASAKPFTERVQKGQSTLYRARFAGLDNSEAEAACRTLKQSGFACFATHN